MDEQCKSCFSADVTVLNSQSYLRPEAFSDYIRLQQQGFQPTMCEDTVGKFRVCYSERQKAA
jgi:hypothetical protein